MRRAGFTSLVIALALAAVAAWARTDLAIRRGHGDPVRNGVQIYPTADHLPANLLRLYLVFDRPMSAGESRAHLTLLDDTGRPVEGAFLQLDEELWDTTGTRLTVLFDPGRIKRGLRANLESGPPLVEGRRYTLVVGAGWRDADGRPLGTSSSKAFVAVAADRTSPLVDEWIIDAPTAETRQPLVLRFPEILDRALLSSTITIIDAAGTAIRGAIEVGPHERTWMLIPERPWRDGDHQLRVSSELEDVAGNNPQRLFDADVASASVTSERVPSTITRALTIRR